MFNELEDEIQTLNIEVKDMKGHVANLSGKIKKIEKGMECESKQK